MTRRPAPVSCLLVLLVVGVSGGLLHAQATIGRAHLGLPSSRSGQSIASLADLDGDGLREILIGAPDTTTAAGPSLAGRVTVLSGRDGTVLHEIDGSLPLQSLGRGVAGVDDLDGDGYADFVVGGASHDGLGSGLTGHVVVYSGLTGVKLYGINGVDLLSEFGSRIVSLGDVDGDARGDFAVAAHLEDGAVGHEGAVYVFSGATGTLLHVTHGGQPDALLGWALARVGDVDGDGLDDLAIGAPGEDAGGLVRAGAVRIVSGATGALLWLVRGAHAVDNLGESVAGIGDFDADGTPDVMVGVPLFDGPGVDRGRIQIHSGANGAPLHAVVGALDHGRLGKTSVRLGDRDGDGVADLLTCSIEVPLIPGYSGPARHFVHVFSGGDGSPIEFLDTGLGESHLIANAITDLGDLNGDGRCEFALGNPTVESSTTAGFAGGGLTRVFEAAGPINRRVHRQGAPQPIDLAWIPTGGDPFAIVGSIFATKATPGASGVVVASLDQAELLLYDYLPLLVSLDPYFVGYVGFFGFDANGAFSAGGLTRSYPVLAGLHLHLQVFETTPLISSSNALRIVLTP
ncbi:MAG: FG-GAP repeat protein [Planctomycetes bacterium]|nr:FG-GAP repeat protein [Planctomycetota bacterium]